MKQFLSNLKEKTKSTCFKACVLATTGFTALGSVVAHADTTDDSGISTVTSSITSSLSSSKADFVTALGAVVAVGVGFFILKFVVKQVINYFSKVASKG